MTARRKRATGKARFVRCGVSPALSEREVQALKKRAAGELRSLGNYVGLLIAEELKRESNPPSGPFQATENRTPYSMNIYITANEQRALRDRAAADRRSVSSYVARVIVEHLGRGSRS